MPYTGKRWALGTNVPEKPNTRKNTNINHPKKAAILLGHGNEGILETIKVPPGFVVVVKSHSGDIREFSDLLNDENHLLNKANTEYLLDPIKHIDKMTEFFGSVAIYRTGDRVPNLFNTRIIFWDRPLSLEIVPSGMVLLPLTSRTTPYLNAVPDNSTTVKDFLAFIETTAYKSTINDFNYYFKILEFLKSQTQDSMPVKPLLEAYEQQRIQKIINTRINIPKTMTLEEYYQQLLTGFDLSDIFELAHVANSSVPYLPIFNTSLANHFKSGETKNLYRTISKFAGYLINSVLKYPKSMTVQNYYTQQTINIDTLLSAEPLISESMRQDFVNYLLTENPNQPLKKAISNYVYYDVLMRIQEKIPLTMSLKAYLAQSELDIRTLFDPMYSQLLTDYIQSEVSSGANFLLFEIIKGLETKLSIDLKSLFSIAKEPQVIYMFACRFINNREPLVPEKVRLGTNNVNSMLYTTNTTAKHINSTNISGNSPAQRYLHALHQTPHTRKIKRNASGRNTGKLENNTNFKSPLTKSAFDARAFGLWKNHKNLNIVKTRSRVKSLAPEIKQQISESLLQRRLGAVAFNKLSKTRANKNAYVTDYLVELSDKPKYAEKLAKIKKFYPNIENKFIDKVLSVTTTDISYLSKQDIEKFIDDLRKILPYYQERKDDIQKAIDFLATKL